MSLSALPRVPSCYWLALVAESRSAAAVWPSGSAARVECLRSAWDALARARRWRGVVVAP